MALRNRETLKNFFKKGTMPSEANFADLIESTVNIADDGLFKNIENGIVISPSGSSQKVISFFKDIEQNELAWSCELGPDNVEPGYLIRNRHSTPCFYISPTGNTGINTISPKTTLEVNGYTSTAGLIGGTVASVPANGQWQDIVTGLEGCNALEIIARVGKENSGKYALLHAHALSTFGRSCQKIKTLQAHYGWPWNKMKLRWHGDTFNYKLQIKTYRNYGDDVQIQFHIKKLWNDKDLSELFNPQNSLIT